MPEWALIEIPEILPKYALIEPLAVCVHALDRIKIDQTMRILISGYGCIGKLCGWILKIRGYTFEIYDPRYTDDLKFYDFDVILECSGTHASLDKYMNIKGVNILLFGFEYQDINPSILSSNEMSLVGTLGSNKRDFKKAIELMKEIDINFISLLYWYDFESGLAMSVEGKKVVFNHKE